MAQVAGALARLLTKHHRLCVYEAERVNDHFSFHGLDWVNNYGNGAGGKPLEGLLGIDIDRRQPAAEARMGMIPSDNRFGSKMGRVSESDELVEAEAEEGDALLPSRLPQHIHHLHLKHRVHRFDTDAGTALRHCEYIYYSHSEVIDKFAQHETHDFHRHAGSPMPKHL
jgi:hypothetical protein